jgi:hypothetical protein
MVLSLLALFVALGGTAYATTDGKLVLGRANDATAQTALAAPVAGPALQVSNASGGAAATALELNVAAGHPPLTVNSSSKVTNLNADQLDGIDSSGFYAAGSKVADSQHADTAGSLSCAGCLTGAQLSPGLMKRVHWVGSSGDTASFTIGEMELRVECHADEILLGTINHDPDGQQSVANVFYSSGFDTTDTAYVQAARADFYAVAIRDTHPNVRGGGTWMFVLPAETDSAQFFYRRAADPAFEDPSDHSRFNCSFDAIFTHLS